MSSKIRALVFTYYLNHHKFELVELNVLKRKSAWFKQTNQEKNNINFQEVCLVLSAQRK